MITEEKIDEILFLVRTMDWKKREPKYPYSGHRLPPELVNSQTLEYQEWINSRPGKEDIQKPGNPIWELVDAGLNSGNDGHERWYLEQIGDIFGIVFEREGRAP